MSGQRPHFYNLNVVSEGFDGFLGKMECYLKIAELDCNYKNVVLSFVYI